MAKKVNEERLGCVLGLEMNPGSKTVILAVSGGGGSVVMLDYAMRYEVFGGREIMVAHFDHGIREDSSQDLEFVRGLAERHGLKFVFAEGKLGKGVSEEKARKARYGFLKSLGGELWTAHHYDDALETVAINLIRGTGWRGLAVLGDASVRRFFIEFGKWGKKEVLEYARVNNLGWREDSTNADDRYLRNRVRRVMEKDADYGKVRRELGEIFLRQREIAGEIDEIVA
ncbi:tRNA lysidine(34) synthetase TilS, partial [Candidatus Saccharibacteria bacterium]|nr:tRNA lysidine(34) synthetase TilS [Candidatus Saccharibacteria bacterium]